MLFMYVKKNYLLGEILMSTLIVDFNGCFVGFNLSEFIHLPDK